VAAAPSRTADRVRELWSAELERPVGDDVAAASFFDLGGHSIKAMRLLNRIRDEFTTEYSMLDFYKDPTIVAMTTRLDHGAVGQARSTLARPRVRGTL
jgi:iturin family lipopeptide synthetase A